MVEKRGDPLAWETRVNQGAVKKRSLFYMDGWHFLCPVAMPGVFGILLTAGTPQAYWIGFTVVTALGAIALHQFNPWFLDDYLIELMSPIYLTDVVADDLTPLQRVSRRIGLLLLVEGSPS